MNVAPSARISPLADIEESVRGTLIAIGDNVVIDAFVKIKPVGGKGDVVIGAGTYVNSGCVLYSGNGLTIGAGVLIAANCTLAPVNHEFHSRHKTVLEQRFAPSRGGIIIEDDVWIGANSVVLDGTRIRQGAVIGAGSVVVGEIEPFTVQVGNPLRRIGVRE